MTEGRTALARLVLAPRPAPAPRVLVIDDDALARRMLAHAFAARGCEWLTADDGYCGFHRLVDELLTLDLVVTDVQMPGLSGVELVHKVRRLGGERDVAIVAVSAFLDDETCARLTTAGADAILDKRIGPDAVAGQSLAALRTRRAAAPPIRP
ncbi:MAG TPA: response regulator [Anaeromyxobacteraceae bacterium]|nr:response regulator [Anaeromyxobacteraceae bacterium]